jgi:hypothetical protein
MPDDDTDKTKRAQEIDKAIKEHDARKKDSAVDLANQNLPGGVEGVGLNKLLTGLDAVVKRLYELGARMDGYDDAAKKRDDARNKKDAKRDDDERRENETAQEYEERCRREGRSPGEARDVVADSTAPQSRFALLDAQAAAEKAYSSWGLHAPKALYGEKLRDFETRLARGLQRHSKRYAKSDLESITDRAVWADVLGSVYADAITASTSPDSIPPGRLRMKTERLPSGHVMNSFYGDPASWMSQFSGARKFVRRISPNPKFDEWASGCRGGEARDASPCNAPRIVSGLEA